VDRFPLIMVGALLLLAPLASAQQPSDPTVNDSDFNTTAPPADTSYMDENSTSSNDTTDPTVSDSDFDTSVPSADTSYLDQAAQQYGVDESGASTTTPPPAAGASKTPGPETALVLGLVGAVALALAQRRRSG
jgi:cytoskeletal protein RodZ